MVTLPLVEKIEFNGETYSEVKIYISHKYELFERDEKVSRRQTTVEITIGEQPLLKGIARCYEPDNFCRAEGRRRATSTCFRKDKDEVLSEANRSAIMQAVCPELFTKPANYRKLFAAAEAALKQIVCNEEQTKQAIGADGDPDSASVKVARKAIEDLQQMKTGTIAVAKNPVIKKLVEPEAAAN